MYWKKSLIKVIKYWKLPYAGGSGPHMSLWIWNKGQSAQGLYTPPHIPGGLHLESSSTPGVHLEFRQFFFGDNPANFLSRIHLESSWPPVTPSGQHGLHLRTQGKTN